MKKNLALKRIQNMTAYQPPLGGRLEHTGMLLDFNERTVANPSTVRALEQLARGEKLQLYPEYFDLTDRIAEYAGVEPGMVMITSGADQGIDAIFRTFADKDDAIVIPSPSFAMFWQHAGIAGNRIISPKYVGADLNYPLADVLDSIDETVKVVVVCNPNNPTGTLVSLEAIEQIAAKAAGAIVFVDEAYYEFSGCTAAGLIDKYPNIIVTRTFSKAFGLASLRIGYIIARPEYITEMLKVRGPYDVNQAAYYAAGAALSDTSGMKSYAGEVMEVAKPYVERFFRKHGVKFYPSTANLILMSPDDGERVAKILEQNGILVRPQHQPGIEGTLRLTIGTAKQMKRFTKVYEDKVLGKAQKYAFLDRDGTLIFEPQDDFQVDSLEKLRVLDGVIEGLRQLMGRGYKLIMITNQDGLGTSSFPTENFEAPQAAMMKIFADEGIKFERVFICAHLPEANCVCRKPKTTMLDEFLRDNPMDTSESFVCGDRPSDEGLAKNLGVEFLSVETNGNFLDAIGPLLQGAAKR